MKFEGAPSQARFQKPLHEEYYVDDQEEVLEVADETAVTDDEAVYVDEQERALAVSDRLEAREFSKEHSQFYRDRLARKIWQRRYDLRSFLDKQDKDISSLEESRESKSKYLEGDISRSDKERSERLQYVEKFDSFKREVSELESEIESIKSSFWKKFVHRDKLSVLESQRRNLSYKEEDMYEPDRARLSELDQKITKYKDLLDEHQKSEQTDRRIAQIRDESFFRQDTIVSGSKQLIKEFYEKNLDLKNQHEEDPAARDVAENCREMSVMLRHGVPIPDPRAMDTFTPGATGNNSILDSTKLDSTDRIQLALALQPAISTHTSKGWSQGLLVGAGEITAAGESDLFTFADGLDSRNPKYEEGQASSLMPDIKQRFKDAVENQGKPGNVRLHNEIVVKHPKFSAVYTVDNGGKYGVYNELDGRNLFDTPETRWAHEQSIITGLPAVVILESGKMINIATDEEVTMEELLARPVEHSVEERLSMFSETLEKNVTETGVVTAEDLSERFEYFDVAHEKEQRMEQYKQMNRELAEARLHALEYERAEANRRVKELFGE